MDDKNFQPAQRAGRDVFGQVAVLVRAACGSHGQTTEPAARMDSTVAAFVLDRDGHSSTMRRSIGSVTTGNGTFIPQRS